MEDSEIINKNKKEFLELRVLSLFNFLKGALFTLGFFLMPLSFYLFLSWINFDFKNFSTSDKIELLLFLPVFLGFWFSYFKFIKKIPGEADDLYKKLDR